MKPFLRWAGGKTNLLPRFASMYPDLRVRRYLEPFVGGGSVFLHVRSQLKPKRVLINDFNRDLVITYRVVRDHLDQLVAKLESMIPKYSEKYYYKIRDWDPKTKVGIAARFIYLNGSCFNGLYRVNSKGKFNVPFGKRPRLLVDVEEVKRFSRSLQGSIIKNLGFKQFLRTCKKGDFIYFDPPYDSAFTSYTKNRFAKEDQKTLASEFRRLDQLGCLLMLSNNDTPLIRKLYKGFRFDIVESRRSINPDKSGKVPELVIRNFSTSSMPPLFS